MEYRILNGTLNPRLQCVPLRADESPELQYVKVEDKHFAYDPNSMALLEIGSVADYVALRKDPPSPYIMARYKPNFLLASGAPKIQSMVLETTHDCNLACSYPLHGKTLVPLLNGTNKPLQDMVGQAEWVYSVHEGHIIPTRGTAVLSAKNSETYELIVEDKNGVRKVLKPQPIHRFMLADGTYRMTKDLKAGDRLMPLYRKVSDGTEENNPAKIAGYEMVMDPATGEYHMTHVRVCDVLPTPSLRFKASEAKEWIEPADATNWKYRQVRHHYDINPRNNSPENLFWMSKFEHKFWHLDANRKSNEFWTPERRERLSVATSKRMQDRWNNDQAYREQFSATAKANYHAGAGKSLQEASRQLEQDPQKLAARNKAISDGHVNATPEVKQGQKSRMAVVGKYRAMRKRGEIPKNLAFDLFRDYYYKFVDEFEKSDFASLVDFVVMYYPAQEPLAELAPNHVVISVRKLQETADVYCLVVDHPCHNFAVIGELESGVTSNEKDANPLSAVISENCFVRNYYSDHGTGNYMTFKTAKAAIDRLLDPKSGLSIGFFGGEPMLNMPLIREVVAYAQDLCNKHGSKASFHVTTNGTLYTPENIDFLDKNNFSLITSIDGTSESHDALRPMKRSGKGSHKQIVAGLRRLSQFAISKRNTLRSTFTSIRGETITERLEFLNQLCDDGMASWVSVEPAALSENTCFVPNQDMIEIHVGNVWNRFYDEYMKAADWWVNRAKSGMSPRFHNFHKTIERILWTIHSGSECGAGRGYASVNAKGEIFGCHRESNSYLGTLISGIDAKLQAPWLDNRIYTRTGCQTCGKRYACGGGCREDSLGDKGNIHEPSLVHCALKDLWFRGALKIMATLPKQTLAKYCPEPKRGKAPKQELQKFLPVSVLPRDANGIIETKWVSNIPLLALTKEGAASPDVMPQILDRPESNEFVDTGYNPAGPDNPISAKILR